MIMLMGAATVLRRHWTAVSTSPKSFLVRSGRLDLHGQVQDCDLRKFCLLKPFRPRMVFSLETSCENSKVKTAKRLRTGEMNIQVFLQAMDKNADE